MTAAWDAAAVELDFADLDDSQCPAGSLATGARSLAAFAGLEVGVWEHPVGMSTDVEVDEVFVVVSGRGRVLLEGGRVLELHPGVVAVLEAGTPTTWVIEEPLRKVWVVAG